VLTSSPRLCFRGTESIDAVSIRRMRVLEVESPSGPARVYLHPARRPRAGLVLGHGAAGGVESPDLVAVREVASAESVSVALVEQPYRVAGRRAPAPASQLDAAWVAVLARLQERELRGLPLLVGGRSMGARVACRTAALTGARYDSARPSNCRPLVVPRSTNSANRGQAALVTVTPDAAAKASS